MRRLAGFLAGTVLWLIVAVCLAITIVPRFLDHIYYRGPASGHFDGERFFNPDGADDVRPGPGFALRYLTRDDRPAWPSRVAIAPSKPAPRVEGRAMVATWVGHATVLVQTEGLNILTDPVWSDTVGPLGFGPRRVAAPGIRFEDLPKIDLVLVSHNHYDHLDLATLRRLWERDRPIIVTSLGNDAVMGFPAKALDWGGRVAVKPGVEVVVTRSHHWDSRWFADRNRALWSSFVVRLPGGNLFFAGDTGAGDLGWADDAARLGPVRLALIPIGAFRFEAGQMASGSHIGPVDAVEVFRRLGAANAIGVHWGTFRLSYDARDTPPKLLAATMRCAGLEGFHAMPIGAPRTIPPLSTRPSAPAISRDALLRCLDTPAVRALR
ncbi:MBL fold metallo-hydrolase [Sphingomonas cannabina]|uniref:MBL fold metallo-hydrolase n=1 Tax=Sphingomonas cannabina TaxID=2899123 RepID=UPI001F36B77F|nr:MBL fold metallo-hydrolase [Sphingomonas cannabina]UIJ45123.1 MBL fold metallo-hydrolase [Sphingomonas cannabina]